MQPEKLEQLEIPFNMYKDLLEKIKNIYSKTEEYLIPTKPELDDILYEAESYMKEVFTCIVNASNGVSEIEKAFLDKIMVYKGEHVEATANDAVESTFGDVPKYIKLANMLDKQAETNYATELVKDTLAICKKVMDIDGNTYADESSFTYSFIDMLEKYIKGK